MTEIAFHINIANPLEHVQRLLQKIWKSEAKAVLIAPDAFLQELSQALWAQTPSSFWAHSFARDDAALQAAGGLVLCTPEEALQFAAPDSRVLLQWHHVDVPVAGFERYPRFIELVPSQDAAKAAARQRWKYYQTRGYALKMHDMQAPRPA
mgnify:CR=1 FL=1